MGHSELTDDFVTNWSDPRICIHEKNFVVNTQSVTPSTKYLLLWLQIQCVEIYPFGSRGPKVTSGPTKVVRHDEFQPGLVLECRVVRRDQEVM